MAHFYSDRYEPRTGDHRKFVHHVEDHEVGLPLLSRTSPTPAFKVAAALVELSRNAAGNVTARVTIPEEPNVAETEEQRKILEKFHNGSHPDSDLLLRFLARDPEVPTVRTIARASAGGAVVILDCEDGRYLAIGMKDSGASIHALHLVAASGLSQDPEEWLDPRQIVASEMAEEILIYKPDPTDPTKGIYLLPKFERESEAVSWAAKRAAYERYDHWSARNTNFPKKEGEYWTEAQVWERPARIEDLGSDEIIVTRLSNEEDEVRNEGRLVIDPEFGAIDLVSAVIVTPGCKLSELVLIDGELLLNPFRLLNRFIFAFRPSEFAKILYTQEPVSAAAVFKGAECLGTACLPGAVCLNPPLLQSGAAALKTAAPDVAEEYRDHALLSDDQRLELRKFEIILPEPRVKRRRQSHVPVQVTGG